MGKRKIVNKKVPKVVAFCSVCKEALSGNGSLWTPYKCSCGIWESTL